MTDLRDFAEKLYVSGTAQEAEFAKEILEYIGDRSNLLEEIEDEIASDYTERLKMAGIEAVDVDDIIRALLERLPTEWDL